MVPARSSRHGISCSRHLSRSQAEIPLIPAVQISRASSERQQWTARQVEDWLAVHRNEAEIIRRYIGYKLGTLWDNGHMSREVFERLSGQFWNLHSQVTAVSQLKP
jgi:hypothetical protein